MKNLFKCIEGAGLRVEDYVFGPLAASEAVLSKRQKELGVMLVDIGGGTASFLVFEEGVPLHAGVLPIGGNHITNDIAIGLRVHVDVAERIKLTHGSCLPSELPKKDNIRLADFVPNDPGAYSKRELAEIVEARLRDVFELLQKELKKIGRDQLLPAGIVFVGGSSIMPSLADLAKREVKLPVEIGAPELWENFDQKVAPSLATVLGLLQWAQNRSENPVQATWRGKITSLSNHALGRWLRSLLP